MLSEKDEQLIAILRKDARLSVAEIARRMNVSRTAAQARLEKLENNGVIAGYHLQLSSDYLERQVKALVMIKSPPANRAGVEARLAKISNLISLHSISGQYDLSAELCARSVSELDRVIDEIGTTDGVTDTMSSIILSTKIER